MNYLKRNGGVNLTMEPIEIIAKRIGLNRADISLYGDFIAKIKPGVFSKFGNEPKGKLILISALNPTSFGEGKTTISIGLLDAFNQIGKKAVLSLREPSLGPVFGMKGGATGFGLARIEPSDEINLHFTGDMHAIAAANNLLCALVDNHLMQGNALQINPKTIVIKRCVDVNDRALRNVFVGLGATGGVVREESFTITAASEVMAILCFATSWQNLKERLGEILIGFSFSGEPVFVKQLNVQGALAVLLKAAIWPNLVQTLNGSPVLVHGGPFANIAHGCCSVMATKLALNVADYAITEAGFGADLGAEKFFDIKCDKAGFKPNAVVLVATAKALKAHGGVSNDGLLKENPAAVRAGCCNLAKHVENMRRFGVEVVVAVNKFSTDFESELAEIAAFCNKLNCVCEVCDVAGRGPNGALGLAHQLIEICDRPVSFKKLYGSELSLKEKTVKICTEIYGAAEVVFSKKAQQQLQRIEQMGFDNLPVCVCKTPYSLSADGNLVGAPSGFKIEIGQVLLFSGAGMVTVLTGNVLTMPGFGKQPAALHIDLGSNGETVGLF